VIPRHLTIGSGSTMGSGEAVIADAVVFGDLLYLSGRAAVDPGTLSVIDGDFDTQAHAVLADIDAVLEAAGSTRALVLRVECFLAHAADFASWNRVWSSYFTAPRPARTTVVAGFAIPGILIELQITAAIDRSAQA
jgi:2-iminobutanoate/2-iminopropanoate deaminase